MKVLPFLILFSWIAVTGCKNPLPEISATPGQDQNKATNSVANRSPAPPKGSEMKDSGLIGDVVAGSSTSYEYIVPEESEYGYALFTHEGKVFGVYHPKAGDKIKIDYETGKGVIGEASFDLYQPEKTTYVVVQGREIY